jgi:cell division septation protein DedD
MTPPDDEHTDGPDHDLYDETPPRSIFAATWFRALLVLIVLGVVGAVAVPYILDAMNPPPKSVASRPPPAPSLTAAPRPAAPPASAVPTPAAPPPPMDRADKPDKPDKPVPADKTPIEKPAPATPRKPAAGDRTAKAAAPEKPAPEKPVMIEKPVVEKPVADKPAASAAPEPKPKAVPKRAATRGAAAGAPKGSASGEWWVQVGAFRDHDTAKKLAAKLREQGYKIEESTHAAGESPAKPVAAAEKPAPAAAAPAPAGADQYDVFVSGLSAAELNRRLAAKGLAAEPSGGGAVIKPSLPLRDAVALSKDLAIDGFKVQVKRSGSAAPEPAPRTASDRPAEPAAGGGETLFRVRVGAFADRATATTTLRELEGKGYKGYVARGGP